MAASGDLAKRRCVGGNLDAGRASKEIAAAAGQDEAGEAEGERRLADAARARDQPGMMQAPRLPGAQQSCLGGSVADEDGILARRRDAYLVGHDANVTPSRRLTAARMADWTASGSWRASMTTQRCGSLAAIARKPSRRRR